MVAAMTRLASPVVGYCPPTTSTSPASVDGCSASTPMSTMTRDAALVSPSSMNSEDRHTVAGSIPTACSSSSMDSQRPIWKPQVVTPSTACTVRTSESDMTRLQELEAKRLALRHQRFSLEQRLFEFCGRHSEVLEDPGARRVEDWAFLQAGLQVKYSGPLNEQDEPHGTGRLQFADGQIYEGQVVHGMRSGKGRNIWADAQEYNGDWKNNSRNGRGTHTWPDGRKVSGHWENGHLEGKVYFSWPNGATFDGMVKKGKKHGRGIHTWSDGRVYSGNYENGKEHGFGTLAHPDGVKYRGQFCKGVKEGYGIMLWKTRTYDGEWKCNKPHGQGRVVWSNGATYTGHFEDGKYHGLGVYVWPSGKKFVGRWYEGVKQGHGLYQWPNGKKFDGEYKNGLKHGYGRMTWPDGSTYCGGYANNQRSGRGVQATATGEIIHCGEWKDDIPVGKSQDVEDLYAIPAAVTVPPAAEHDICSPQMVAGIDDNDDDDTYGYAQALVA